MLVIAVGLPAGYWLVHFLLPGKKGKSGTRKENAQSRRQSDPPPYDPPPREPPPKAQAEPMWYEVLNVSPTATIADIKTAYRELIRQYHPDKVASLGPELRDLAVRKSQAINEAYSRGLQARGTS